MSLGCWSAMAWPLVVMFYSGKSGRKTVPSHDRHVYPQVYIYTERVFVRFEIDTILLPEDKSPASEYPLLQGPSSSASSSCSSLKTCMLFKQLSGLYPTPFVLATAKDRKDLFKLYQQKMKDTRAAGMAMKFQSKTPKCGVMKRINLIYHRSNCLLV